MSFEAEKRANEIKKLHEQVRAQIEKVNEQNKAQANKNITHLNFQHRKVSASVEKVTQPKPSKGPCRAEKCTVFNKGLIGSSNGQTKGS